MNNDEDKLINQLTNRGPGVKDQDQKKTTCNHHKHTPFRFWIKNDALAGIDEDLIHKQQECRFDQQDGASTSQRLGG
jgi:hypothetical protein